MFLLTPLRWMATEAAGASPSRLPTPTPTRARRRPPRGGVGSSTSAAAPLQKGFLDVRPTPWTVAFGEAQTAREVERMIDQWASPTTSSSRQARPTLREAVAAVSRLSALAAAPPPANNNGSSTKRPPSSPSRESAARCAGRVFAAIEAPTREAAAAAAAAGVPGVEASWPAGPALSAAHLLVQSVRLRAPPDASGLGASLVALATSGAGGRASTNPAIMALWSAIRLAEIEARRGPPSDGGGGGGGGGPSEASSVGAWRGLARRARGGLAALVLRHWAGRDDFGAPASATATTTGGGAAAAASGRGGGAQSPPAAPPPQVHSNSFNLAVWSIAAVGPPYSPEELSALEVILQGAARFYASPPPPTSPQRQQQRGGGGGNGSNSNSNAHQLPDLPTLFIGLGRLNSDLLPVLSARGVPGGKESHGRAGAKRGRGGDQAPPPSSPSSSSSSSSSSSDWRSLGQEAVSAAGEPSAGVDADVAGDVAPDMAPDAGPFLARAPGQAGQSFGAASPSLQRALRAAGEAAALAVPDALAAGRPPAGGEGQLYASIAWGLAMCAGVYDPRAMDAVAAAAARALATVATPAAAGSSSSLPAAAASFHPEHFARLSWAFARKLHYAPEMLDAISRAAVPQMLAQGRRASEAAAVAAAMGAAHRLPPRAPSGPRVFNVQHLANLAWGAAFVGYTRDPRLYHAALECAGAPPALLSSSLSSSSSSSSSSSPPPRSIRGCPQRPSSSSSSSSALEADGRPLHLCLLLWAAASAGGGRAPDAFVAAAAREVARYDRGRLPWTLAMQLLQATAAGVEGPGGAFALPPGALEVLAATAERNKVRSSVSDFQRGLAAMAGAAVALRRKEWAEALSAGGGEEARPPPTLPEPQLEARPPGSLFGDVDVLVHWLPPPPPPPGNAPPSSSLPPPAPVAVALEADGPSHFCRSAPCTHLLGRTLVRDRALRALGLAVATVPHWEWARAGAEERAAAAAAGGGGFGDWRRSERAAARMARLLDAAAREGQASGL